MCVLIRESKEDLKRTRGGKEAMYHETEIVITSQGMSAATRS